MKKRKSGPKSGDGKRRVSSNSTKHGLTSSAPLRCRKDFCYFRQLCPIAEEIENLPPGSFCPVEVEMYHEFLNQYHAVCSHLDKTKQDRLARELALLEIRSYRCSNAVALHSEMIRNIEVPLPGEQIITRPEVTTLLRYKQELLDERIRLIKHIKEENS